ncbi:MAG: SPFH domain-containing protein, partial [Planctomycetes bacterium]|nr:SPFH domain-containing protein [Planctomycetota bacterium]
KNLPPDEIIATKPGQKGIQLDPLPEGRFFYNPYDWDWQFTEITTIPAGRLGVVTRLYGKELPPGEIIAPDGYKGIATDILSPGKYRINPYAEKIDIFDAITIRPGRVGVVTHLSGLDTLHGDIPTEMKNVFIVSDDVKGVQEKTFGPGTYYLNPYIHAVTEVNLQSQRFELQGDDAITFLTQDGFVVVVEGTLEFAITRERAPQLTHQVGDVDDILKKIILPRARGFSRIEGSKHPAIAFIVGETRQEFQNSLEKHLVAQCLRWGIDIRSMLIRNITPPEEVAAIIREREVALQNQRKIEQQIEQARSQAELTRQEMLAVQNREKVESETIAIRARIQAEQEQSVRLTSSHRELEVAKLEAEAAKLQADAVIIKAEADRDVVRMKNEAEASVTAAMSEAFGGGVNLARYTLYQKTAPLIQAIISTDRAPGLGGIFKPFMPESDEVERNQARHSPRKHGESP